MNNQTFQTWQMERFRTMLWLSAYERMGLKLTPEMVALKELMQQQQVEIERLSK
jgi:hypothetical protein